MPRSCTVCALLEVAELDAALAGGESIRSVAERFATSKDAVARHAQHGEALPPPADEPELELRLAHCGHYVRAAAPPTGYVCGFDRGVPDARLAVWLCADCARSIDG